jgi:hypothetical protein
MIVVLLSIPNHRDQVHGSSAGVIKQTASQRITEEESKEKEQEKQELRSLQQKIKE